jgi:hypothetical protein
MFFSRDESGMASGEIGSGAGVLDEGKDCSLARLGNFSNARDRCGKTPSDEYTEDGARIVTVYSPGELSTV